MSSKKRISCTDDELKEELLNLGYSNVSPSIFNLMKLEFQKLLEQELTNSSFTLESNSSAEIHDCSLENVIQIQRHNNRNKDRNELDEEFDTSEKGFSESNNGFLTCNTSFRDKLCASRVDNCKTFKENDALLKNILKISPDCSEQTFSNSTNSVKTIKRKTLRHKNGQAFVTEESLPCLLPLNVQNGTEKQKSINSANSSSSLKNSPCLSLHLGSCRTNSLNCLPSALSRVHTKKKKNDPVALYNYYSKFWKTYKPPGENTHDKLRWSIRDKMLDYRL